MPEQGDILLVPIPFTDLLCSKPNFYFPDFLRLSS